jgi:pimeloyl-ACP methyl ester carboxylesterase
LESLELESEEANDLEGAFARNWRKILPHYCPRPLQPEVFQALASGTKWVGNEKMLDDVPAIESVAKDLSTRNTLPPLAVFQGEFDEVVPDKNLDALKSLIPSARFHEIKGAGHFPMVEEMPRTLDAFSSFIAEVEGAQ